MNGRASSMAWEGSETSMKMGRGPTSITATPLNPSSLDADKTINAAPSMITARSKTAASQQHHQHQKY